MGLVNDWKSQGTKTGDDGIPAWMIVTDFSPWKCQKTYQMSLPNVSSKPYLPRSMSILTGEKNTIFGFQKFGGTPGYEPSILGYPHNYGNHHINHH